MERATFATSNHAELSIYPAINKKYTQALQHRHSEILVPVFISLLLQVLSVKYNNNQGNT